MKQTNTLSLQECLTDLTARPKDAYKQYFGHILVIGGNYGTGGCCGLVGKAALRSGAGLVSIATRPEHAYSLLGFCPELMTKGIKTVSDLEPLLERATVIVVGPGLGQDEWGKSLVHRVLQETKPLIVDADALQPSLDKHAHENWILTPHPGEAARLLECGTYEIQKDRLQSVQSLQKRYHGTVVLKGSRSLILGKSQQIFCCEAGNPGLATAGTGDVLTGLIAGLVAQELSLEKAARLGVVAHATIGDWIADEIGPRGLLASDIIDRIPLCLNLKKQSH